jgi:prevent-host-death family protein
MYMMSRAANSARKRARSLTHAERVGAAEFRANLAKYLKQAEAGRPVIVQDRGRGACLVSRFDEEPPPSILGSMSSRTEYVAGSVVDAGETWAGGEMP